MSSHRISTIRVPLRPQPDKMFGAPAAAPKIPHSVTPPTLERMSRASGTDANTSAKTWAHYLSLDKYLWKAKDSE